MHMYMLSMHMLSVYICIGLGSGGGAWGTEPHQYFEWGAGVSFSTTKNPIYPYKFRLKKA